MSLRDANGFLDKADKDAALRKEARAHYKDIVKVGAKHGFHFSHDDLDQAFRARKAAGQGKKYEANQCQSHFDEEGVQCQCHAGGEGPGSGS